MFKTLCSQLRQNSRDWKEKQKAGKHWGREPQKQKLSITTDSSFTTLSSMEAAWEYYGYNFSNESRHYDSRDHYLQNSTGYWKENNSYTILDAIDICRVLVCLLGIPGNGMVIWLLGFRVQRNPFMTYILNLAVADLGLLISLLFMHDPSKFPPSIEFILYLFSFIGLLTYSAGQFLLTAISIGRCVAVFFPLWHRCHRPPRLHIIVCALMWVLSFLLTTVTFIRMYFMDTEWNVDLFFQFIVNAVLCLPLLTVSTLALFIKVCFKQQQHRRGKLLTILLLTLAFFLLFAFPLNVMTILSFYNYAYANCIDIATLLTCLNSSVNPVIYFLVGRQRKTRRKETLKMILQKAFKEEEEEEKEESRTEESPAETEL